MGVCEYTVKNCDKLSSAFNKGDTRRRGIMRGILKRSDKNWLENLRSLMVDYYASVEGSMDTPTPGRSCHVCPHCGDGKLYSSQHAPVVKGYAEPAYPDEPSPYTYTYGVADDYSKAT